MRADRFRGCLIGQCLGDALGFPVEGSLPEHCASYVAQYLGSPDGWTALTQRIRAGQYTDDSQLARELMQSFVHCRGFDPEDYARRIAAIFTENRVVGRGLATERAARRLAAGTHWTAAGDPAPSAGNGSAMRAGPVGLLFHRAPDRLAAVAHDQSRITHQDPRCSAGSAAIATAVALALGETEVDRDRWAKRIAGAARPFDEEFAGHLARLGEIAALEPRDAARAIPHSVGAGFSEYEWSGISPFVVPSVLWSLYAFLRSPDDSMESMRTAIAVGGDVDTTAAMAGAISGAWVGLEGLPAALAERVTDRGTWGYGELVALADRCHEIVASESGA